MKAETLAALVIYGLALTGLFLITHVLWPALLLGLGTAVLCGIVWVATRRQTLLPMAVIRPRTETWLFIIWYGIVILLDAFTRAGGIELVNQFTNWFFLVMAPVGLLVVIRRSGLRDTLRSVGFTRSGLKDALKLTAVVIPLSTPILYVIGEQQRAGIQLIIRQPLQAIEPFALSFVLALLTAGFVEEFFFRGLLQSRLAFYLHSEWRGLLVASLLFGLFHLPLYLYSPFEPTRGNFAWALTSILTEQAVTGILLGALWARTHHLAAPVFLHAFINALAWMTNLQIGLMIRP